MRRLVSVALLAIVASACGQNAAPNDGARTIDIEMRDFAFTPESLTLTAGETVRLRFKNVGKLEHEFMAGTDPAIGMGYLKDWLAGAQIEGGADHDMGHAGEGVRLAPNTTATVTIVVPGQGGVFEFGCFVTGHYESGMRGRLVVDTQAAPKSAPGQGTGGQRPGPSAAPTHPPMDDDGEGH
jgi:uncharacterized cupredoxin-like copper-binding protein